MTTATDITPGLHFDLPAKLYHADPCPEPSLSSSVLRTLIEKTPAHANLEHPRLGGKAKEATDAMNFGSCFHAIMAGDASELEVIPYDDFRSKDAKAARHMAKEQGLIPVLEKDVDRARWIAASVKEKAFAGATYHPGNVGQKETTAIWQEDGCWMRARFDALVMPDEHSADLWDYKTTTDVSERAIMRSIIDYGYHLQAAFYMRGLRACVPSLARVSFIFVFVEVNPPFAVRVVCLSPAFLAVANREVSKGVETWKHCLKNNTWPAYEADTLTIDPPSWLDGLEDGITES